MSNKWNYDNPSLNGEDARKLVTLVQNDMTWVGIRHWSQQEQRWYNGSDVMFTGDLYPRVIAWKDLPDPAQNDGRRVVRLTAEQKQELDEGMQEIVKAVEDRERITEQSRYEIRKPDRAGGSDEHE